VIMKTKEERDRVAAQMRVEIEAAIDAAKSNGKTVDKIVILAARGGVRVQKSAATLDEAMTEIVSFLDDGWRFRRVSLSSPAEAAHVSS